MADSLVIYPSDSEASHVSAASSAADLAMTTAPEPVLLALLPSKAAAVAPDWQSFRAVLAGFSPRAVTDILSQLLTQPHVTSSLVELQRKMRYVCGAAAAAPQTNVAENTRLQRLQAMSVQLSNAVNTYSTAIKTQQAACDAQRSTSARACTSGASAAAAHLNTLQRSQAAAMVHILAAWQRVFASVAQNLQRLHQQLTNVADGNLLRQREALLTLAHVLHRQALAELDAIDERESWEELVHALNTIVSGVRVFLADLAHLRALLQTQCDAAMTSLDVHDPSGEAAIAHAAANVHKMSALIQTHRQRDTILQNAVAAARRASQQHTADAVLQAERLCRATEQLDAHRADAQTLQDSLTHLQHELTSARRAAVLRQIRPALEEHGRWLEQLQRHSDKCSAFLDVAESSCARLRVQQQLFEKDAAARCAVAQRKSASHVLTAQQVLLESVSAHLHAYVSEFYHTAAKPATPFVEAKEECVWLSLLLACASAPRMENVVEQRQQSDDADAAALALDFTSPDMLHMLSGGTLGGS